MLQADSKSHCTLETTGRRFYVVANTIGITDKGTATSGSDDVILMDGPLVGTPWTDGERAELADEMIRRWTAFKAGR